VASRSGVVVLVLFGLAAVAIAGNDGDIDIGGDGDFDWTPENGDDDGGESSLPACDGIVVVSTAGGSASVPGEGGIFSSDSARCTLREGGGGDGDAIALLQTALAQCNGQSVVVDGDFGPQTTSALQQVQRANGLTADGVYGPATLQAMRWPGAATSGDAGCMSGASPDAVLEDG
jgi:hypothetical protein